MRIINTLLFCWFILLICSCSKETNSVYIEATKTIINDSYDALECFSIALSKAACEYEEVRQIIKDSALERFDNDYDVLYRTISSHIISSKLGTFRDVISSYMNDPSMMRKIEDLVPSLTIYVSDATWFDPEGFCADNWNVKDNRLAITFKGRKSICQKLFSNGYYLGDIEAGTIPGGPVLIVTQNERVIVNASKSGNEQFAFINEAFDGRLRAQTKDLRHTGKYTTSWIAGQTPEDSSDTISAEALNALNPDIITAYNLFKDNPYAHQNDYIYYGLTPESPRGILRQDVRSRIVRFKISPRSFVSLFDDANDSDKNFSDYYETDDNGKGMNAQPSESTIYSKLWADGALEIRVRIAAYGDNDNIGICKEYYYDVKARDLYTVKDYVIKKEQWGATAFKWYITWRYSISGRDNNTLVEKWYYPENGLDMPTWDLFDNSAFTIVFNEEDTGAETTYTISETSKKANQLTVKISRDMSGSVGADGASISATIKNELGWTSSDEKSKTITTAISCKNEDDHMGTEVISYSDKYIVRQATPSSYIVASHSTDRISFTILPYRY